MLRLQSISLEDARRIIAAGEAKTREIKSPSNVAVVDVGGNFVAHIRMDKADRQRRRRDQQGLHLARVRYRDRGSRSELATRRVVLRHPAIEPRPHHGGSQAVCR